LETGEAMLLRLSALLETISRRGALAEAAVFYGFKAIAASVEIN
jgi:hypothetical protein